MIRLDFSAGILQSRTALDQSIRKILRRNQRRPGLICEAESIPGCSAELIIEPCRRLG